jgi:hypothetical protein
MTQGSATQRSNEQAIRPFPVASVPEAELTDLRKRINATRWPERDNSDRCNPRSTASDDAGAGALLGDRLRLAQVRGTTPVPAELYHRGSAANTSLGIPPGCKGRKL